MLVLASAIGCVPPSDNRVVGVWESEAKSRGGIGHVIQFKPSGEVLTSMTVLVDLVYRIEGGKLFVAEDRNALAVTKDGAAFTVQGNILRQPSDTGDDTPKTRIGTVGRAANPIVGDWRYRHYTGAIAFERYTQDGHVLFRLPMSSQLGCYSTVGQALEIATPDSKTTGTYEVNGDTLELNRAEGESHKYRRTDLWYPLDQIDYQKPK